MKNALSIADLMQELRCSKNHAADIMMNELPRFDIRSQGSQTPRWRVKRRDFEKWLSAREVAAGNEKLEAFAQRYVR